MYSNLLMDPALKPERIGRMLLQPTEQNKTSVQGAEFNTKNQ